MMRTSILVMAALLAGALAGARLARALPGENRFVLEEHDRIIAEAPGCYASCEPAVQGRACSIREPECRPVCVTLPECKVNGVPMRVCTIVRDRQ